MLHLNQLALGHNTSPNYFILRDDHYISCYHGECINTGVSCCLLQAPVQASQRLLSSFSFLTLELRRWSRPTPGPATAPSLPRPTYLIFDDRPQTACPLPAPHTNDCVLLGKLVGNMREETHLPSTLGNVITREQRKLSAGQVQEYYYYILHIRMINGIRAMIGWSGRGRGGGGGVFTCGHGHKAGRTAGRKVIESGPKSDAHRASNVWPQWNVTALS